MGDKIHYRSPRKMGYLIIERRNNENPNGVISLVIMPSLHASFGCSVVFDGITRFASLSSFIRPANDVIPNEHSEEESLERIKWR
jgi:hypothetical protein